jgi:hypothetical protein
LITKLAPEEGLPCKSSATQRSSYYGPDGLGDQTHDDDSFGVRKYPDNASRHETWLSPGQRTEVHSFESDTSNGIEESNKKASELKDTHPHLHDDNQLKLVVNIQPSGEGQVATASDAAEVLALTSDSFDESSCHHGPIIPSHGIATFHGLRHGEQDKDTSPDKRGLSLHQPLTREHLSVDSSTSDDVGEKIQDEKRRPAIPNSKTGRSRKSQQAPHQDAVSANREEIVLTTPTISSRKRKNVKIFDIHYFVAGEPWTLDKKQKGTTSQLPQTARKSGRVTPKSVSSLNEEKEKTPGQLPQPTGKAGRVDPNSASRLKEKKEKAASQAGRVDRKFGATAKVLGKIRDRKRKAPHPSIEDQEPNLGNLGNRGKSRRVIATTTHDQAKPRWKSLDHKAVISDYVYGGNSMLEFGDTAATAYQAVTDELEKLGPIQHSVEYLEEEKIYNRTLVARGRMREAEKAARQRELMEHDENGEGLSKASRKKTPEQIEYEAFLARPIIYDSDIKSSELKKCCHEAEGHKCFLCSVPEPYNEVDESAVPAPGFRPIKLTEPWRDSKVDEEPELTVVGKRGKASSLPKRPPGRRASRTSSNRKVFMLTELKHTLRFIDRYNQGYQYIRDSG